MSGITALSFGYELPDNTATGDQFFPALERNISRMNAHTHDGSDGAQIAANLQELSAEDWSADLGGGSYRQEVTMPGALEFDNTRIEVRTSAGEVVYPTIVKTASNKFYLYTNDNTAEYVVSYV